MPSYSREDLLALTPDRYLAAGFAQPDGSVRREFLADYATAAGTQFLAADLSPQELALTAEAVRQILPLRDGAPGSRARGSAAEALGVVAHAIQQPNNEVLAQWLTQCAAAVSTEADLQGFLAHLQAVERQYPLLVAFSPKVLPPPSQPSSQAA
jgi:hypothetical protein